MPTAVCEYSSRQDANSHHDSLLLQSAVLVGQWTTTEGKPVSQHGNRPILLKSPVRQLLLYCEPLSHVQAAVPPQYRNEKSPNSLIPADQTTTFQKTRYRHDHAPEDNQGPLSPHQSRQPLDRSGHADIHCSQDVLLHCCCLKDLGNSAWRHKHP